jgi:hypothetical protein
LRRIFGPKRDEVRGELNAVFPPPNIKTEMGRVCSTYVGDVHTGIWWGDLSAGDHLENNIKMNIQEVGWCT